MTLIIRHQCPRCLRWFVYQNAEPTPLFMHWSEPWEKPICDECRKELSKG